MRKGVTLVELVIVIIVVGILAGGFSVYMREVVKTWNTVMLRSDAYNQARVGLMRIDREIRLISGKTAILNASLHRFRFNTTLGETVNFNYTNSVIMRNNDILSSGITDLSFYYYNKTGAAITAPAVSPDSTDIRTVAVHITAGAGTENKTIKTIVFPRNLGD